MLLTPSQRGEEQELALCQATRLVTCYVMAVSAGVGGLVPGIGPQDVLAPEQGGSPASSVAGHTTCHFLSCPVMVVCGVQGCGGQAWHRGW